MKKMYFTSKKSFLVEQNPDGTLLITKTSTMKPLENAGSFFALTWAKKNIGAYQMYMPKKTYCECIILQYTKVLYLITYHSMVLGYLCKT
nr:MAG TPA: hypothetical protein [Bacteriophage sp.]